MHKSSGQDDKRLQNTLKRLGVNTIPGIEEVNIFKDDTVVHFTNPKVQASIAANTYVISGPSQTKSACPPGRAEPLAQRRTRRPAVLCPATCVFGAYGSPAASPAPLRAELQDMLPGIINQLGPDSLQNLKRIAAQFQGGAGGAGGDDDVPEVETCVTRALPASAKPAALTPPPLAPAASNERRPAPARANSVGGARRAHACYDARQFSSQPLGACRSSLHLCEPSGSPANATRASLLHAAVM